MNKFTGLGTHVQRRALSLIEVVALVIRNELEDGAFRQIRRLVHDEWTISNPGS